MTYKVLLERSAQRDFRSLDSQIADRVQQKIDILSKNPRTHGAIQLRNLNPPRYRIRVGQWRILYVIDDEKTEVRIYRIKHRSKAY